MNKSLRKGKTDDCKDKSSIPDCRAEMRQEIRTAIAETLGKRPMESPNRPSDCDAANAVESDQLAEMMQKIDANNAAHQTAIRLANIKKEENKHEFLDMIEIKDKVNEAIFLIKESIVTL